MLDLRQLQCCKESDSDMLCHRIDWYVLADRLPSTSVGVLLTIAESIRAQGEFDVLFTSFFIQEERIASYWSIWLSRRRPCDLAEAVSAGGARLTAPLEQFGHSCDTVSRQHTLMLSVSTCVFLKSFGQSLGAACSLSIDDMNGTAYELRWFWPIRRYQAHHRAYCTTYIEIHTQSSA